MPKTICPRRPVPDAGVPDAGVPDAGVPDAGVPACHCRFSREAPSHHDLLARVDTDVTAALELFELATTWQELDYSGEAVLPPGDWLDFAAEHCWTDPDLAERLFSVAVDVATRRGAPAAATRLLRVLA